MVWVPKMVTALVGQWAARGPQHQHSSSYMYALPVFRVDGQRAE